MLSTDAEHRIAQTVEGAFRSRCLTRAFRDVLRAFQALSASGVADPTEKALADLSGASTRTVRRAKVAARALGLLNWDRQYRVWGGKRREAPCLYRLTLPDRPIVPRPRRQRHEADKMTAQEKPKTKEGLRRREAVARLLPVQPSVDLLAARRRVGSQCLAAWGTGGAGWRPPLRI